MAEQHTPIHWPRLLRCPHCDGRSRLHPVGASRYWRASCDAAMTCGAYTAAMSSLEAAAEAWNRRADAPAGSAVEPPIYWRCFHCDFIARDRVSALEHFGPGINERPPSCQLAAIATTQPKAAP